MGAEDVTLILGSGSASRRQILSEMGYEFEIVKADIDEKAVRYADAAKLVQVLGNLKADAVLAKLKESGRDKQEGVVCLLTGDQVVEWNGPLIT